MLTKPDPSDMPLLCATHMRTMPSASAEEKLRHSFGRLPVRSRYARTQPELLPTHYRGAVSVTPDPEQPKNNSANKPLSKVTSLLRNYWQQLVAAAAAWSVIVSTFVLNRYYDEFGVSPAGVGYGVRDQLIFAGAIGLVFLAGFSGLLLTGAIMP